MLRMVPLPQGGGSFASLNRRALPLDQLRRQHRAFGPGAANAAEGGCGAGGPPGDGGGGHRKGGVGGRGGSRDVDMAGNTSLAPPPCFAWSTSPKGEDRSPL